MVYKFHKRSTVLARCLCVLVLTAISSSIVNAQTPTIPLPDYHQVYLPTETAEIKLLGSTTVPFGRFFGGFRYQQVYDASLFTNSLPKGGGFLWRIFFRPGCGGKQGVFLTNMVLRMSTTSRKVGELSDRFHDNLGNDVMAVVSAKLAGFNGSNPSCRINPPEPGGDGDFFVAQVETPFFYDPSKGNLVMEIVSSASSPSRGLDPTLSPIWGEATPADAGTVASIAGAGADAVVAEVRQPFGLVTHFTAAGFPRIHLTPTEDTVILSWNSHPGPTELQEKRSLDSSQNWRPYSGPLKPFRDETRTILKLPRSSLQELRYYRLFWNSPQIGLPDTPIGLMYTPVEVSPDALP